MERKNENKMFEAISNPDAYDKNGNFDWVYYRRPDPTKRKD